MKTRNITCALIVLLIGQACIILHADLDKHRQDSPHAYVLANGYLLQLQPADEQALLNAISLSLSIHKATCSTHYETYRQDLTAFLNSCTVIVSNQPQLPRSCPVQVMSKQYIVVSTARVAFANANIYSSIISNYWAYNIGATLESLSAGDYEQAQHVKALVLNGGVLTTNNEDIVYEQDAQSVCTWFAAVIGKLSWNEEECGFAVPGYQTRQSEK